jgi:hypothetical protein
MTFSGIITETEESKRQDMTLQHCAGRSVGSEPKVAQLPRGRVPVSGRMVVASRIGLGAGTSRDGRRHSTRLDLRNNNFRARRGILGLRWKRADFGEEKNPPKPHANP